MTSIVFYFQVHQPYRLRQYPAGDVGRAHDYFDDAENRRLLDRIAERCYRPMNAVIAELVEATDGAFRCAFSLSGTVIEQMRAWSPRTLDSFVALAETGSVEFLAETSHHSLAGIHDEADRRAEFEAQVRAQMTTIEDLFGRRPTTFRNTELIISEPIAATVERLGFDVLLGEGADRMLGWRSPELLYRPRGCERLKLLLRSYMFSDDIGFRFSNRQWPHYPLYAETFATWLHDVPASAQVLGLFMDYETFGEHQWADTGIFEFMRHLPGHVLEDERFSFRTPAEVGAELEPAADLEIPGLVSWADAERDLTAWLGNLMQRTAHDRLWRLLPAVRASGDPKLLATWRRLTTSDHVYWMCTKFCSDGDVHEYFSPCVHPHDAFVRLMTVLDDLERRLAAEPTKAPRSRKPERPRKRPR